MIKIYKMIFVSLVLFLWLWENNHVAQNNVAQAENISLDSTITDAALAFPHQLKLNSIAGLPSEITITLSPQKELVAHVRALFVLDGKLLVIPFGKSGEDSLYHGTFPTPTDSLHYQFQFISVKGKSTLSPVFQASPLCTDNAGDNAAQNLAQKANRFPKQPELLQESFVLQRSAEVLSYVISGIKNVAEGGTSR